MVGTRVYIGCLPYGVNERDLERFFRGYGRIRDVLLKNGYGFCEFDDYRDADDAVYELNGKELLGERVIVEHARGTARRERGYAGSSRRRSTWMDRDMDVRNDRYGPPTRTDYRDLKDFMRQAGEVTYADAHKSRRNEGVVEFASYSDMKNAIDKLDDTELNGRRVRLIEDSRRGKGKRSRSSSSRSRSRSYSRSRRRSHTRSRSRSRSSRSKSRRSSHSKSASRSKSRSRSKSKSRGHSKSKSKSRSRSRSKSVQKERSKSRSQSQSNMVSTSSFRERTPSRSPSKEQAKSKSRSASKSPEKNDNSP